MFMISNPPSTTADKILRLRDRLNEALVGKSDVVEMVIACILAKGHLLFDDLPGLGKTTLSKALANSMGAKFARVQCTPDLLPSDISGFNIYNQKIQEFEFREGPVFSELLLADEINRATPRTQSALLEAMAERQVTIDNQTMTLSDTFLVIATQNPIESHGAYPLPEAQLDRFAIKLSIGYPDRQDEIEMLGLNIGRQNETTDVTPVLSRQELQRMQAEVQQIEVKENVRGYLVDLATATRNHNEVPVGLSPRGLITWQRMAQSWAYLQDRSFVIPDDIQTVAKPVLGLRIAGNQQTANRVVEEVINAVEVPGN
jgi:MoxR-like ATPase